MAIDDWGLASGSQSPIVIPTIGKSSDAAIANRMAQSSVANRQ